jgi:hypothetical protein
MTEVEGKEIAKVGQTNQVLNAKVDYQLSLEINI